MSTHGSTTSQLYVTDIAIEFTGIDGENIDTSLELDELCVFGPGGVEDDGKLFALTKVSPTRWTMPSSIELPPGIEELLVIFKGERGDIGFVRLDCVPVAVAGGVRPPQEDLQFLNDLLALSNSLNESFQRTGRLEELSEAIVLLQRVIESGPWQDETSPGLISNLGSFLSIRANITGSMDDHTKGIAALQIAAHALPDGHPDRAPFFHNLGYALYSRFKLTRDFQDLSRATSALKKAAQLNYASSADLPEWLEQLGLLYCSRYEHRGNPHDLAEAVSALIEAVHWTPEGDEALPQRLNHLGVMFLKRFKRNGDLEDLKEATSLFHKAANLTPGGGELACVLNNLGLALRFWFQHTGDLSDFEGAFSAHDRAICLAPEGKDYLRCVVLNYGTLLQERFQLTGNVLYLSEAIAMSTQAVQLTPQNDIELPGLFSTLAVQLRARFRCTYNPQDLEDAIIAHEQGLSLMPNDHMDLARSLLGLAQTHYLCSALGNHREHLDASISNYRSAATNDLGKPDIRIAAAMEWAKLLNVYHPQSVEILTAFEVAIHMVAMLAGLELTVQRRYSIIEEYSGLPLDAATAALRLNRPDKAVEWLEESRCLVWGQQNRLRTPHHKLHTSDPALAAQIIQISSQLELAGSPARVPSVGMPMSERILLEDENRKRLGLAKQWSAALEQVRSMEGFEAFLQPSPFAALVKGLPPSGPVVLINVHRGRCDAIALLAELQEPLHIALPHFSLEKASHYRKTLNCQLHSHHLRARQGEAVVDSGDLCGDQRAARPYRQTQEKHGVHSVLEGLWTEVVKPVLDMLGFSKRDEVFDRVLPRIWWCPTGPLSFLPLHAAGRYRGQNVEGVMDYAVSSYTPTVTSLVQRVEGDAPVDQAVSGLFLTCQPKAPGAPPIPGTAKEVELIQGQAAQQGINYLMLDGDLVTADECLEHMERYSSVHLACHASQNASNPLQSQFLFHRGNLTLNTIMQRNIKNADLAFLSACETSTGEERLSDEAVHLAAGMLAAGYRRVVATMWSIEDHHAPQVADEFYQHLWGHRQEGNGVGFDGKMAAHSLHHAIHQLRGRLDNSDRGLLSWIPYVHFGY